MLDSIFTLDVRFLVDTLAEAELIRDNFHTNCAIFEAIEDIEDEDYCRVRFSCTCFGYSEYLRVCEILGEDYVAFSVYSK